MAAGARTEVANTADAKARNLALRREVVRRPILRLSRCAIRRLVVRLDPELARRRGDRYKIAQLARRG